MTTLQAPREAGLAAGLPGVDRLMSQAELYDWLAENEVRAIRTWNKYFVIKERAAVVRAFEEGNMIGWDLRAYGVSDEMCRQSATMQSLVDKALQAIPVAPDAALRLSVVAKIILSDRNRFNMQSWHGECGTTHCIAGWAQTLWASREHELVFSPALLGRMLLGHEAAEHFFDVDEQALEFLSRFED